MNGENSRNLQNLHTKMTNAPFIYAMPIFVM